MEDKRTVLANLRSALDRKEVTPDEVGAVLADYAEPVPEMAAPSPAESKEPKKGGLHLNAVETMFYLGGLILFAALMTLLAQEWDGDDAFTQIALSAGAGTLIWFIAFILKRTPNRSDMQDGLANSLILTGSLAIIVGGYVILNNLIDGFDEANLVAGSVALLVLAALHYSFDQMVNNVITIIMSAALAVLAFPVLFFGIVGEDVSPDIGGIIVIITAVLLAQSGRIIAQTGTDRGYLTHAFDSLAALVVLITIYSLSFGSDFEALWQLALPISILGMFYMSIVRQSRQFLNVAALFLIIYAFTISFRYFSDHGAVFSLVIAAMSIIGTAMIASNINKKYIKQ